MRIDLLAIDSQTGRIVRTHRDVEHDDAAVVEATESEDAGWAIEECGWAGYQTEIGGVAAIAAGSRIPAAARAFLRDAAVY